MWFFIILIILVILYFKFKKNVKLEKLGAYNFVSGAVKSGKSTLSFAMAYKEYKRNKRKVRFANFIGKLKCKLFTPKRVFVPLEEPLFYSNIPLNVPYVLLTEELVTRMKRFSYGSIIFVDEASFLADSQLIKEKETNAALLLFNKLIGHELGPGGKIFLNSQSISDLHYSVKRVMSNYLYVHSCHKVPLIPLYVFKVRELFYSDDHTSVNNFNADIETDLKTIFKFGNFHKHFDAYCYSTLTDDLEVDNNLTISDCLKAQKIVSFRKEFKEVVPIEKK